MNIMARMEHDEWTSLTTEWRPWGGRRSIRRSVPGLADDIVKFAEES